MKIRRLMLALLFLLMLWITIDLLIPVKTDIRQFDPAVVARLDTDMWRSYYDRKPLKLFFQLSKLLRKQFHAPFWRSQLLAYDAAKAAFVFKDGKERPDYEKALPVLQRYYTGIHRMSSIDFNVTEAARLELEWWIVHRQRAQHQGGDLEKALAESAAVIYNIPPETLTDYAKFRTAAMDIRDTKQEKGGVSEEDWAQIADLLHQCWQSLYQQVNIKLTPEG